MTWILETVYLSCCMGGVTRSVGLTACRPHGHMAMKVLDCFGV